MTGIFIALSHCSPDSTSSEAHLLMAQIQLYQGNYKQAQQSLEVGLSYNFEVRDVSYLYPPWSSFHHTHYSEEELFCTVAIVSLDL